jgi:hypothetical protein
MQKNFGEKSTRKKLPNLAKKLSNSKTIETAMRLIMKYPQAEIPRFMFNYLFISIIMNNRLFVLIILIINSFCKINFFNY